ncbi:MAG TPA: thioesterase family protein [Chitinophagaceae bacterium]|nr:thioesterase family protein [Chitinophagaceae bacterium]
MFVTETEIRVRYAETDQMGVVYHSNFFLYFEVARTESIRQLGFTYAEMEKLGIIMPVTEVHSRFLRPARYDDLLTVRSILKELPFQSRIEFHHEVYNESREQLASGRVVLYFMEAGSMKKASMPDALYKKLQPYFS